jgi:glyoxylase I family protein
MERVTGIGGVFFRSREPKTLAKWYADHLGVTQTPETYEGEVWVQTGGPTVFQPFPEDTSYFGRDENQWMVNFRVSDLDAMVDQLRAAGVDVDVDGAVYPNGRFAHLSDPEGNRIELWEPAVEGETPG